MLNKCIVIFSFSLALASSIKAQNNVACINQDEVINRMPEVALANNILKQFQDSLQQIIQKRRDEYYEKMTNWMKTCGDILTPVPDSSRAKKRQDAIDEVVQLSQLDSDMQLLIKTKAINLFKPILDKFKTELKKIANENGYAYVIDICAENTLPFSLPPCTDITTLVITKWGL